MEDWEAPDGAPTRRAAPGVLAVLVVVVVVGLAVRSPLTAPEPNLTVDPSPQQGTDEPSPQGTASPGATPVSDGLLGARGGAWTTAGFRPDVDLLRASVSAWTGEELLVAFSPRVAAYDPDAAPREAWRDVPPHPGDPKQVRGAVHVGRFTYVYGIKACAGCEWLGALWRLDPAAGAWVELPSAPEPASQDAEQLLAVDDQLVVLRDAGAEGLEAVAYDLATGSWSTLDPPVPGPVAWRGVTAGARVVVVGQTGILDDSSSPGAIVYDAEGETWRNISQGIPMDQPHLAAPVWTGEVVVYLGAPTVRGGVAGAELDPATGEWTTLPPLPLGDPLLNHLALPEASVTGLVGTWDGERATFVGGLTDSIFVAWSPQGRDWEVRYPPVPQTGGSAVWTGEQILLWGGADRNGPLLDLRAWPPGSN